MVHRTLSVALLLMSAIAGPVGALPRSYSFVDIGITYPYANPYISGLNDSGVAAGTYITSTDRAFVWQQDSGLTDLGTLGGLSARGNDINNSGTVVGSARDSSGASRPFIWTPGSGMKDLGTLGEAHGYALAISETAQVAGEIQKLDGSLRAFTWQQETGMRELGTLSNHNNNALGINNIGQVVGDENTGVYNNGWESHAFVWDASAGIRELACPGGRFVAAADINDSGVAVGYGDTGDGQSKAIIWLPDGSMRFLGTLGGSSYGDAINSSGLVVGHAWADNKSAGYVWQDGIGMVALNTMLNNPPWGVNIYSAGAVNNNGWIAGQASFGGLTHLYVLIPSDQPPIPVPVPEPGSLLMLGCGAIGLALPRRRTKSPD